MHDQTRQELGAIWERVREDLRRSLPRSAFDNWVAPVQAVHAQGNRLYLAAPEQIRRWFERRYEQLATEALKRQPGGLTEIGFSESGSSAPTDDGATAPRSELPLDPNLDFDRFVIGTGNRFAHAAALAVAERPGDAYNPLFIYGKPGLGKSHLLAAIANYLNRQRPELGVLYTTAERFTSEFVSSVRGGGGERFKQRYRGIGALLIDDVHFLEHKPRTEEEFFHTFNELYAAGKQIVLSSDRSPEAIERLGARLRDRFAWGLTVKVSEPDLPTRITMLRRLASERALPVPSTDMLRRIALATPTNLRLLEGALTRVIARSSVLGQPPSPELVEEALGDRARPNPQLAGDEPTLSAIQSAVSDVLRVPLAEMKSPRRAPELVRGRQLAMYVARRTTSLSLAEIARGFDRDHSTVLHSIRSIERRIEPGSDLHRALERIHEILHTSPEPL